MFEVGTAINLLLHLPGRRHVNVQVCVWSRDRDTDLTALNIWGTDAIVSLVTPSELSAMGVPNHADAVNTHGVALFRFRITDMSTPGLVFHEAWTGGADVLMGLSRIVVHFAAGLGRTGWSARDAIQKVRSVRPGAIETRAEGDDLPVVMR